MSNFLAKITKNLTVVIPVTMATGFVFGIVFYADFLKNLIIPFTFLMVYPMMVNLNIKKVFEGGDLKAQILTQVINFGIVPFLSFGVGLIFFKDNPYMALGLSFNWACSYKRYDYFVDRICKRKFGSRCKDDCNRAYCRLNCNSVLCKISYGCRN